LQSPCVASPFDRDSRNKIAARRVPASSRPALRDVAKTYVLQNCLPAPGAGLMWVTQSWRTCRGGEKPRTRQLLKFYRKWVLFSSSRQELVDKQDVYYQTVTRRKGHGAAFCQEPFRSAKLWNRGKLPGRAQRRARAFHDVTLAERSHLAFTICQASPGEPFRCAWA
jgi:hypothetical protein